MLNEEQKKHIRQMAADGAGYRKTLKCVLASKQDIIDYRNELVETGWTSREEETDAEWKQNSCLWCGNREEVTLRRIRHLALSNVQSAEPECMVTRVSNAKRMAQSTRISSTMLVSTVR